MNKVEKNNEIKMKWFNFYIYWQPWLMALFIFAIAAQIPKVLLLNDVALKLGYMNYYIFAIIFNTAFIIFQFILINKINKRDKIAAKLLKFKMIFGIIIPVIDFFSFYIFLSKFDFDIITSFIFGIVIYFINVKYFNKRLYKFNVPKNFKF